MITMTMTRQAAEALREAIGGFPCGTQANVEAYQAVTAALERDTVERAATVAREVRDMDQALNRKLWGGEGAPEASRAQTMDELDRTMDRLRGSSADAAPNTFPVYLSAADIGDLSRWVRATGTMFGGQDWRDRVLAALRGAR